MRASWSVGNFELYNKEIVQVAQVQTGHKINEHNLLIQLKENIIKTL
jgi:hypothetical protein